MLPKGIDVWYFERDGRPVPAKVIAVHYTDVVPFYTVMFDSKHERETERIPCDLEREGERASCLSATKLLCTLRLEQGELICELAPLHVYK